MYYAPTGYVDGVLSKKFGSCLLRPRHLAHLSFSHDICLKSHWNSPASSEWRASRCFKQPSCEMMANASQLWKLCIRDIKGEVRVVRIVRSRFTAPSSQDHLSLLSQSCFNIAIAPYFNSAGVVAVHSRQLRVVPLMSSEFIATAPQYHLEKPGDLLSQSCFSIVKVPHSGCVGVVAVHSRQLRVVPLVSSGFMAIVQTDQTAISF